MLSLLILLIVLAGCTSPESAGDPPELVADDGQVSAGATEEIGPRDPTANLDAGNPDIGREYFYGETRGRCLKCHTLAGEGDEWGLPLDDVGLRFSRERLAIFIDNPRNVRPEVSRMPPWRGDEVATIADVVAFLMTFQANVEHPVHTDVKPENEPDLYTGGIGGYSGHSHGY